MPIAYQNTPCSIFASGCAHLKKKGQNDKDGQNDKKGQWEYISPAFIPCVKLQLSMYSTDIEIIISQTRKQKASAAEIA